MRRIWKWLRRIVLGTLAFVVVAVIAALIIVHTDWGRDLIRAQLEAALAEIFPGGAHVGKLEGSVFGELVVSDVELRGRDGLPMVTIKTVRVELSLVPLIGKTAHFDRLIVEDVVAHVHNQGPKPPERSRSPLAWSVELPQIEVRRVEVVIETAFGINHLDGVSLVASANAPGGLPITATALIGGTWRERKAPIAGAVVGRILGTEIGIPAVTLGIGGVAIAASDLRIDDLAGHVMIAAPAAALVALVPGAPATSHDAFVVIDATPVDGVSRIDLAAHVGETTLTGAVIADIHALTARGVIAANRLDLTAITRSKLVGSGDAVLAFVTDGKAMRGTVIARGVVDGAPSGHAVIAFDAVRDHASAMIVAAGAGGALVAGQGAVHRTGTRIDVERARFVIAVRDPAAASGGYAKVTGVVGADLTASGTVVPLALEVTGTAQGTQLGIGKLTISSVQARFSGKLAKTASHVDVTATSHVDVTGVTSSRRPVGSISLDAATRADGKIDVTARAVPTAKGFVLDAVAVVTPGAESEIAIGAHSLRMPTGRVWTGRGGHVHVGRERILITGVRTTSDGGSLDIDVTVGRGSGVLGATVTATTVPIALLNPAYLGTVNGKLSISRRDDQWTGGGTFVGAGIAFSAAAPPFDGEARVALEGRRVRLDLTGKSPNLGGGHVMLEVDGPRDVTDRDQWMTVPRTDLRAVTIELDHLDAAVLSKGRSGGMIGGKLEVRDGKPSGALRIRGVPTPAGLADADLTLLLTDPGFVDAVANATIGEVGRAELRMRIVIPPHPFAPETWKQLGTGVIAQITASAKDVLIGPSLFKPFGVVVPYRGRATGEITVAAGMSAIHATLDLRDVKGGLIVRGIDAHIEADADANGTRGSVSVSSGQGKAKVTLLEVADARTPVVFDRWLTAPRTARTAPVEAIAQIPSLPARELLAILGRTDLTSGSIAGALTIGGTLGTPTANAGIDIRDVKITQPIAGRVVPTLTTMRIVATWGGESGTLLVTGVESNKGELRVEARGRPDQLASVFGMVDVKHFELSPITAFLPGALVGASGQLDANLTVRGLAASTAFVRGTVHLTDGLIPLTPKIGTLRNSDARITIADSGLTAVVDGKLGAGSIHLDATTGLDGIATVVSAQLTKVSPIGALQPVIDAKVAGTLQRVGLSWTGKLAVTRASVLVPEQTGTKLLDANEPADLIFVDVGVPPPPSVPRPPQHPFLIVDLAIDSTPIEVPDFAAHASASGTITVSVGETIGMDGEILIERGDADIFGHRYDVELGQVTFDGSIDPEFNLKLAHEFSDVVMNVRLYGRASNPQSPEFTSSPGVYTRSQLLGFFLGGEPGGDPARQTREAATGAASALLSTVLGKRLKRYLPFDLDVLRCNPASGLTTASCTGGARLSSKWFVTGQQRINARTDENSTEVQFQYYWTHHWTLEGTGGNRGILGTDLLWRRRW